PGTSPGRRARSVAHHIEPDAELLAHPRRYAARRVGEPADDGWLSVLFQHAGLGQYVGNDGRGVRDPAEQRDVAAADRGAGRVLDSQQDTDRAARPIGLGLGPAMPGRVVGHELGECRLQARIGWRRKAMAHPEAQIAMRLEQGELAMLDRSEPGHVSGNGSLPVWLL